MCGVVHLLPPTPSWRDAQICKTTNLNLRTYLKNCVTYFLVAVTCSMQRIVGQCVTETTYARVVARQQAGRRRGADVARMDAYK
jgi:hypothetical protein